MIKQIIVLLIILAVILILGGALYSIDETEQVVITQFGRPIGDPLTDPGLHFKLPFIQNANYFRKNLLEWDGDPGQIPTLDKTFIGVDTFARWRIKDPLRFYEAVNNEMLAQKKLDDILDAATINFITSNNLIEAVRSTDRLVEQESTPAKAEETEAISSQSGAQVSIQLGREKMTRAILEQAAPKLEAFGIEVVDLRIKRINYVQAVREKVYERMIAERKQISQKYRSEGKGESKKIEGQREKELLRINSGAYRKAQEIKGKADAEATSIYAAAYGKDPDFYSFVKTLDIYKEALDKETWIMLSTQSDFFKYLKEYEE
jgi:membrane protease subunit HflC